MKSKIIPKDYVHLSNLIAQEIKLNGSQCDLNHIDVSNFTDLNYLFAYSEFNGNISNWNVSKVTNMENMFFNSKFNGDISNWDVSNVTNMIYMFNSSDFNQDISRWNVSNLIKMGYMFQQSKFKKDLSNWKPYQGQVDEMFEGSKAPTPYWAKFIDKNERKKAIDKYILGKELNYELSDTNNQLKRIKL